MKCIFSIAEWFLQLFCYVFMWKSIPIRSYLSFLWPSQSMIFFFRVVMALLEWEVFKASRATRVLFLLLPGLWLLLWNLGSRILNKNLAVLLHSTLISILCLEVRLSHPHAAPVLPLQWAWIRTCLPGIHKREHFLTLMSFGWYNPKREIHFALFNQFSLPIPTFL